MASNDRTHWDARYAAQSAGSPALPTHFVPYLDPLRGVQTALEIACGTGQASVWLAQRGVRCSSFDISPVAIEAAAQLASSHHVGERCVFRVADFDDGLPPGDPVDLVLCNMFRDAALDDAIMQRLRPSGTLAIAALSEVGAAPGRFRVAAGELTRSFSTLDLIASDERDGVAWLLARKA